MSQHEAVISMSNKVTGGGVVATSVGWVTSEAILGIVGLLLVAIFGCIGVYYRRKDDKRKEETHVLMKKWYDVTGNRDDTPRF